MEIRAPAQKVIAKLLTRNRSLALFILGSFLPGVGSAKNVPHLPSVQAMKTGRFGYLTSATRLKSAAECRRRILALRAQAKSAYGYRSSVKHNFYHGKLTIAGPKASTVYFAEFSCKGATLHRNHSVLIADGANPPPIMPAPQIPTNPAPKSEAR